MASQKKSIVYYTNQTTEPWSPLSLSRGIGGSQTAVIYLSRFWAKMGHKVTVFNNLNTQEKEYDGVQYYHFSKFNPSEPVDILIVWRDLDILSQSLNARTIYLDLHDVPILKEFTETRINKINKIFIKSNYHKSLLPTIYNKKIVIIPNGVDKELFLQKNDIRDQFKLIYASDYYRGLEPMLRYGWKIIKKKIPILFHF
ncbi:hypothetical protein KJ671_02460 [Patescibacteria group bacterium]|nr:hypothetical protein [Patescibacteria group bacterium]